MQGCRASQVTTVICQKEVFQTGVSAESLQEEESTVNNLLIILQFELRSSIPLTSNLII